MNYEEPGKNWQVTLQLGGLEVISVVSGVRRRMSSDGLGAGERRRIPDTTTWRKRLSLAGRLLLWGLVFRVRRSIRSHCCRNRIV